MPRINWKDVTDAIDRMISDRPAESPSKPPETDNDEYGSYSASISPSAEVSPSLSPSEEPSPSPENFASAARENRFVDPYRTVITSKSVVKFIVCSYCGQRNLPLNLYCSQCGGPL